MTKEIIYTENYALIVDDSEIKEGDYCIHRDAEEMYKSAYVPLESIRKDCKKIIFHLPLNGSKELEGVPLLPPLEDDVEKLALQFMIDESYGKESPDLWKGYLFGYNKAKQKYLFSLEDMQKVIEITIQECNRLQRESYGELEIDEDKIIQSLKQSKRPTHCRPRSTNGAGKRL